MTPKLQKLIVKTAFGFVVSAAIGYTMKAEQRVEKRIDEHFDAKELTQ
jgi:hypothetical protein